MWFKAYHEFGHGKSMDASNYLAASNSETCNACGVCVKRCPMEAIQLEASERATNKKGKVSVIDPEQCIGCGVCAFKCKTESIVLQRKEEQKITEPPADMREYVTRLLNDFNNPLPRRNVK